MIFNNHQRFMIKGGCRRPIEVSLRRVHVMVSGQKGADIRAKDKKAQGQKGAG